MRLIKNAKATAARSYSLWINRAAFLSLLMPEGLFYFFGIDTNPVFWFAIGLPLYVAVEAARYLDQGISRSPVIVGVVALALALAGAHDVRAMSRVQSDPQPIVEAGGVPTVEAFNAVAVPLVGKWEGKRNTAYLDTIASPAVWTVCYGETRGVKRGDTYTDAQCSDMLAAALVTYREGFHSALTDATKATRLTAERDAAYTSLTYNIGIGAAGKSTAVKRLNAGDIRGGCEAIGWWNRAGQKVVRGLVNRRADETALCLKGLT